MENHRMDVTQMVWKPEMIRLSYVGNPSVNGGAATSCFVDPSMIASITRQQITNRDSAGATLNTVECTIVGCCHFSLYVEESPETVAMLRDKALGYTKGPRP